MTNPLMKVRDWYKKKFLNPYVIKAVEAKKKEIKIEMNLKYGKDILELFDQSCEQFIQLQQKKKQGLAYSQKQALESVRLFFESKLSK